MAKTILIVEDSDDIRGALSTLLEFRGYGVVEATSGRDALERAKEHIPDLIFMDIAMPVVDGIEATRSIRSEPTTSNIPIVAVTSFSRNYHVDATEAGCNEVLSKTDLMLNFDAILTRYLES